MHDTQHSQSKIESGIVLTPSRHTICERERAARDRKKLDRGKIGNRKQGTSTLGFPRMQMRCGAVPCIPNGARYGSHTRGYVRSSADTVQNLASKRRTKVKGRYMGVGHKRLQIVYKQGYRSRAVG